MLLLSPVCHLHYFCFLVPLVMGLMQTRWEDRGDNRMGVGLVFLFAVFFIANVIPQLPAMWPTRDFGLATGGALLLWLAAMWQMCRGAAGLKQPASLG
jgi:hypothetical protein